MVPLILRQENIFGAGREHERRRLRLGCKRPGLGRKRSNSCYSTLPVHLGPVDPKLVVRNVVSLPFHLLTKHQLSTLRCHRRRSQRNWSGNVYMHSEQHTVIMMEIHIHLDLHHLSNHFYASFYNEILFDSQTLRPSPGCTRNYDSCCQQIHLVLDTVNHNASKRTCCLPSCRPQQGQLCHQRTVPFRCCRLSSRCPRWSLQSCGHPSCRPPRGRLCHRRTLQDRSDEDVKFK